MPDVELARLAEGFAEAVNTKALDTSEQNLRLYARDNLPAQPVDPYGVVDYTVTQIPWDPTLAAGHPSGVAAVIVTGSGERRAAALWVLDVVRRLVGQIPPADYTLTGTTAVIGVWSAASPSPPIEAGDRVTATETYYVHVEAT